MCKQICHFKGNSAIKCVDKFAILKVNSAIKSVNKSAILRKTLLLIFENKFAIFLIECYQIFYTNFREQCTLLCVNKSTIFNIISLLRNLKELSIKYQSYLKSRKISVFGLQIYASIRALDII